MPDALTELREAIVSQMQRQEKQFAAQRNIDLPPQSTDPGNPLGASIVPGNDAVFATGYDSVGGMTITPFVWGISTWNGGDVWTGS